jgi:hypothetical protein
LWAGPEVRVAKTKIVRISFDDLAAILTGKAKAENLPGDLRLAFVRENHPISVINERRRIEFFASSETFGDADKAGVTPSFELEIVAGRLTQDG